MNKLVVGGLLAFLAATATAQSVPTNFVAHLSGDQEVPERPTNATGQAKFQLSADGNELAYRLIVANIDNVVASHIHLAPAGVNGAVVAFLFGPAAPAGGGLNGVIAEGVITAANLTGPLIGQDLSVLVAALLSGGAYVNVHTNDGVAPTNSGPGDFPGGEVRGQIRKAGQP
jgi:hypothetical protein